MSREDGAHTYPAQGARPLEPRVLLRAAPTPPYIHIRRTKTAGWQVVYVGTMKRETLRRRDSFIDAIVKGAAYARIHECQLEVDR
jgi:hypothetical protein